MNRRNEGYFKCSVGVKGLNPDQMKLSTQSNKKLYIIDKLFFKSFTILMKMMRSLGF